ncbi:hypothetical protein Air01nite_39020 [Asanoa iriomotensis]|uniref:ABC transmembrane type-1 domain-containing protein n=1 Tax=Asanoa iriomotensis TaxID=234613 RepID=A0ABQ4C4V9_9ACTN|nr:hypothetical protein Air01nite_39020 [Asanoa iriomotensis]
MHPAVGHTAIVSFVSLAVTAPVFVIAGFEVGWIPALEILVGDRGPSAAGAYHITVPLALLGYAIVPVIVGSIVATALKRALEKALVRPEVATAQIRALIKQPPESPR